MVASYDVAIAGGGIVGAACAEACAAAGLKVGIVWAGNPVHRNDLQRTIALERIAALCDLPGVSWFSLQVGLLVPVFMLELVLTHPSYRQNVSTFFLLYAVGGAIPLAVSLPLAVKHRYWRSILWMPTWFAFAFLRRLATLEAAISLPTRPFLPALAAARSAPDPSYPPARRSPAGG